MDFTNNMIGPELITNGTFTGNADGWDLDGFVYGTDNVIGTDAGGITTDTESPNYFTLEENADYIVSADFTGTDGLLYILINDGDGGTPFASYNFGPDISSSAGHVTYTFTNESTSGLSECIITIYSQNNDGTYSGTIDNVSVRKASTVSGWEYGTNNVTYNLTEHFSADPIVTTEGVSNLTMTSVTLDGIVTNIGTNTIIESGFEYGLTSGYGDDISSSIPVAGLFSSDITGLTSGTEYHFRAWVYTSDDVTYYGQDSTFTTN